MNSRFQVNFFLIFITLSILSPLVFAAGENVPTLNEKPFISRVERANLSDAIFDNIERLDSVSIDVRNSTRRINWREYRKLMSERIIQSKTWIELSAVLSVIHDGIINRHAYFELGKDIASVRVDTLRWPSLYFGYTWPDISIFDIGTGKDVSAVNEVVITKIFDEYFNLYCKHAYKEGCLSEFVTALNQGYPFYNGTTSEAKVTYGDGSFSLFKSGRVIENHKRLANSCDTINLGDDFSIVYKGHQSCLFSSDNAYVLKITSFGDWGSDSIYCEDINSDGMCRDIDTISKITNKKKKDYLVVDLQGNRGGTENTPWIAAIARDKFKDNFIQFRIFNELNNDTIRSGLFYGIQPAEIWYQDVIKQQFTKNQTHLPKRGDFCRDGKCVGDYITASKKQINFKKIGLVTNANCASSCDDFVWRAKTYAGAKVYGQPPSTDGSYASMMVHVFLNASGHISTYTASGYSPTPVFADNELHIATFQIPVTRTVDINNKKLEGDFSVLDYALPVSKNNYHNIVSDNILMTIGKIKSP